MLSNREIRQMFSLYGWLLVLHGKDGRMTAMLSGAAYRMRKISDNVESMDRTVLANGFGLKY